MGGLSAQATEDLLLRGLKEVDGGYTWSSDPRLTLHTPLRACESQILALLRSIAFGDQPPDKLAELVNQELSRIDQGVRFRTQAKEDGE